MSQTVVELIPLVCLRCQAPVPAQPDEVAWVCEQCGQGLLLNEGDPRQPLIPQEVFFSSAVQPGQKGRPFWVARGRVSLTERQTYQGDESRTAQDFWAVGRLFYIPAWECTLDETLSLGVALLNQPEPMQPGNPIPFLPVVTPPGDVRPIADFIVMSIEAARRDALKTIQFSLDLESPQLWILK